jgi:hypothetical protein
MGSIDWKNQAGVSYCREMDNPEEQPRQKQNLQVNHSQTHHWPFETEKKGIAREMSPNHKEFTYIGFLMH